MKIIGLYDNGHISVKRNINDELVHLQLLIAGWKSGAAIG